jgi:hypothetical protein
MPYVILLSLSLLGLWAAWHWGGGGRRLALLIAMAFLLRLGGGIALSQAYQAWGYDKPVYHLGYLFPDAMERDIEAYQVAVSGVPLLFNPDLHLGSDQYGGLGLLSAAVYRLLSPDVHRPVLILILAAAFFSLGVPFLQKAARIHWGERTAALAVWIYILYPDGIFFTASQMREPFIIGLSAVALWGALSWRINLRSALLASFLSLLAMLPISPPAAAFIAITLALLVWIDFAAGRQGKMWKLFGLAGIAFIALVLLAMTWNFFREAIGWDARLAESSSGMIANVIEQLGSRFRLPFITLYGLAQPVLPAAIFEPSIPLMKTITLFRAAGWYALLPLLVYATAAAVRHTQAGVERARALWLTLIPWLWLVISSIRAGGDMSDNPRYRVILLVMLSISAAWAWSQARERRDPWFGRILIIEGLFLLFFTQWYAARYVQFLVKLPFITMLGLIAGSAFLVIAAGLAYDRWKNHH